MGTERESLIAERRKINKRLHRILHEAARGAPHKQVSLDDMTAELWQSMYSEDRTNWTNWWRTQGQVSFSCLRCGFPTSHGTVGCEACTTKRKKQSDDKAE